MKLSNFELEIDRTILSRGQSYYEAEAVKEVENISASTYSAVVEGSEDYEVEVELSGDSIVSSYCDCPYDWRPICKHEVAVYYYLKNNQHKLSKTLGSMDKIERNIYKLTKQDLVDFLLDIAQRNKEVRNELGELL